MFSSGGVNINILEDKIALEHIEQYVLILSCNN